jgi:exopolysaccharide production protein ExoQ
VENFLIFAEKGFIVLGLTFFSGVFGTNSLGLIFSETVITLIRFFIWGMSSILVCIYWKRTIGAVGKNMLLFILTASIVLSFIWSDVPYYTLLNVREVLIMTSFGLYFGTRFSLKEQVHLVAFSLLIGGILSTIFAIGFPTIGVHLVASDGHLGAWKGVYGHKNTLGSMMVLSAITFFALPKGTSSLYRWAGFSFSIILILLSTSKTALVISVLLTLIMVFYKNFRWQGKVSVIFIDIGVLILGCVSVLISTYWVELLTGLGRNPTLTGRTQIWGVAVARIIERPLVGYGRGAFWAPNSPYAIEAGQAMGTAWIPWHAHNGLIDLALDVGLIGVAIFLIIYFISFAQALKRAYAPKSLEELWLLAYLTFLAMNNVTESLLLRLSNLYWVLFITVVFTMNQKSKFKKSTV